MHTTGPHCSRLCEEEGGGGRKSVTTIKVIGRKTLNKAETFEEKGLEESLQVDEREVEEKRRGGWGRGKKITEAL